MQMAFLNPILRKYPTNALIYVNTTLLSFKHFYMFQPSRGCPKGVLIYFMAVTTANYGITRCSLILYLHLDTYFVNSAQKNVSVLPEDGHLRVETRRSVSM